MTLKNVRNTAIASSLLLLSFAVVSATAFAADIAAPQYQTQKECQKGPEQTSRWNAYDKTIQVTDPVTKVRGPQTTKRMEQFTPTYTWKNKACFIVDKKTRDITLAVYTKEATDVQNGLVKIGIQVPVTGSYDDSTIAGLKTFQAANRLAVNGNYNSKTKAAMNAALSKLKTIIARINDNNEKVKTINAQLLLLGYSPNNGSYFGTLTEGAVRLFQGDVKLPVTGVVNVATNNKLVSLAKAEQKRQDALGKGIKAGSKAADIKKYQEYLIRFGYNLKADGVYGLDTVNAVKDFQSKNVNAKTKKPLFVNGVINAETKQVMDLKAAEMTKDQKDELLALQAAAKADAEYLAIIKAWETSNPGLRLAITPSGELVVTK